MEEKKYLSADEIKKIELQILDEIDKICNEENIYYSICGGTMIGAVRHKGFIPWDDDIDIIMPRNDYNKFIKIMKKKDENYWLDVVDNKKKKYYYPFSKIVDKNTVAKMEDNQTLHGIWVDIFPVDNLPDNEKKRNGIIKKCFFYRAIIIAMTTDFSNYVGKRKIKKILNLYANIFGKENIIKRYNNLIFKSTLYNNSNYVSSYFPTYGKKEIFEKDILLRRELYDFEGKKYWGIKNFDEYLSQLYGDYMKLPPEEKRRTHKISAWRIK